MSRNEEINLADLAERVSELDAENGRLRDELIKMNHNTNISCEDCCNQVFCKYKDDVATLRGIEHAVNNSNTGIEAKLSIGCDHFVEMANKRGEKKS